MPGMSRKRRRRRRGEGAAVRVIAVLARMVLVLVVVAAVGYALYSALLWIAAEAERRDSASASRAFGTAFAGQERWPTSATS